MAAKMRSRKHTMGQKEWGEWIQAAMLDGMCQLGIWKIKCFSPLKSLFFFLFCLFCTFFFIGVSFSYSSLLSFLLCVCVLPSLLYLPPFFFSIFFFFFLLPLFYCVLLPLYFFSFLLSFSIFPCHHIAFVVFLFSLLPILASFYLNLLHLSILLFACIHKCSQL